MPWYCFVCVGCGFRWEQDQTHTNDYCAECGDFGRRDYRTENAGIAIQALKAERERK